MFVFIMQENVIVLNRKEKGTKPVDGVEKGYEPISRVAGDSVEKSELNAELIFSCWIAERARMTQTSIELGVLQVTTSSAKNRIHAEPHIGKNEPEEIRHSIFRYQTLKHITTISNGRM
jgi:hypothetical protein